MGKLVIKVKEIKGNCKVYEGGEKIVINCPEIALSETDKICIHALASILHYVVALREGVDPIKLGGSYFQYCDWAIKFKNFQSYHGFKNKS